MILNTAKSIHYNKIVTFCGIKNEKNGYQNLQGKPTEAAKIEDPVDSFIKEPRKTSTQYQVSGNSVEVRPANEGKEFWGQTLERKLDFDGVIKHPLCPSEIERNEAMPIDTIVYRGEIGDGTPLFQKRFQELSSIPIGSIYNNDRDLYTTYERDEALKYAQSSHFNDNPTAAQGRIFFEFLVPKGTKMNLPTYPKYLTSEPSQSFRIWGREFDASNNCLKIWAEFIE